MPSFQGLIPFPSALFDNAGENDFFRAAEKAAIFYASEIKLRRKLLQFKGLIVLIGGKVPAGGGWIRCGI